MIAVHGGAGRLPARQLEGDGLARIRNGISEALMTGRHALQTGQSSVDAVCQAVVALEDNPLFNAGHGAALCADGSVELSASVMDGSTRYAGAMVGMRTTCNPVLGAASLLSHKHGLLFGRHGDDFAREAGLKQVAPEEFVTEYRSAQLQRLREKSEHALELDHSEESRHGTVGAVAIDAEGNLAAATSTGGLLNQMAGRVGDTPVVGAGTWADNGICAVSATGTGDAFARVAFARRVADLIELSQLSLMEAAEHALAEVTEAGGKGGCILIGADGEVGFPFNTPQMVRGVATGSDPMLIGVGRDPAS